MYLPFTSFIGYFRRCECSVMPCSRTLAPLAQCAPRLSGESNTGSWRTHTPFCTTASTAQPTEQWVQTVRFTSSLPAGRDGLRLGLADHVNGSCEANAPAPTRDAGALEEGAAIHRLAEHAGQAPAELALRTALDFGGLAGQQHGLLSSQTRVVR